MPEDNTQREKQREQRLEQPLTQRPEQHPKQGGAEAPGQYDAYFLSYSGITLPFNLVGELSLTEVENRNTFFGARYNEQGQTILIHKVVYGEIELSHQYRYHPSGSLQSALIVNIDDEEQLLEFADKK